MHSSEWFGSPRLRAISDALIELTPLTDEISFPGIHFETLTSPIFVPSQIGHRIAVAARLGSLLFERKSRVDIV